MGAAVLFTPSRQARSSHAAREESLWERSVCLRVLLLWALTEEVVKGYLFSLFKDSNAGSLFCCFVYSDMLVTCSRVDISFPIGQALILFFTSCWYSWYSRPVWKVMSCTFITTWKWAEHDMNHIRKEGHWADQIGTRRDTGVLTKERTSHSLNQWFSWWFFSFLKRDKNGAFKALVSLHPSQHKCNKGLTRVSWQAGNLPYRAPVIFVTNTFF